MSRSRPPHHHEAWQIQDDGNGKPFCAACGDPIGGSMNKLSDALHTALRSLIHQGLTLEDAMAIFAEEQDTEEQA